jgi:O-antigen/teichoic acid export membrane protein
MKHRLEDAFWIVSGTALSAIGTLVGIRVLTQFLTPGDYGAVSLALGLSTLTISLVATPLTQAAIHFYPALGGSDHTARLLASLRRCFTSAAPWIALGVVLGASAYLYWGHGSLLLVVILVLLLASDCWRSANLSLLNAARRNRSYALWVAGDAALRPLGAVLAVVLFGSSPAVVLGAYLFVSAALVVVFTRGGAKPGSVPEARSAPEERVALDRRMWAYALPLIPLGVIGWLSNLGDRYIIGAVMSVADAGVYAALYGISSSPFMMAGGTVELALRPIHQAAVARGDQRQSQKMYRIWLATVVAVCGVGVLALALGHPLVASLLVGKAYRPASYLMPWIGLGYAIRSASYVFERMCYAYGQTQRVLVIQCCAAVATLVATPFGVIYFGLRGAAMAVPIYFSVQLAVAVVLARRTVKQSTATDWSPVPGRVLPS